MEGSGLSTQETRGAREVMIIEIMQIIAIIGLVGGSSLIVYKYFSTHGFYGDDNTNIKALRGIMELFITITPHFALALLNDPRSPSILNQLSLVQNSKTLNI